VRVPPDIIADPQAEVVVALTLRERVLEARTGLAAALAAEPGPLAQLALGREADKRRDHAAARAHLARAHALAPTHAEIAGTYARMLLTGDAPDAALAETVTRPFHAEDSPWVLNARGEALLQLGRLDEAEAVQWRALAVVPHWPVVQERRARIQAARQAAASAPP
jgi:tetratricopeptide (TPR) repeat protein